MRDKILDTLPPKQQDIVRDASVLFDVLSTGMVNQAHCSKVMVCLQKALLTGHQIEGQYRTPHGRKCKTVSLQPRRVFLAGGYGCWYLAAHDNADRTTKLFRLARFINVHVTKRPVTVTTDWSLKEMIGNAWSVYRGDREFHLEIEFDAETGDQIEEVRWHATQEIERLKDGRVLFRATVSGLEEVRYWVLGFGPRAKVLKPKQLADEIRQLCRQTLGRYGEATPQSRKERSS